jgi:hypothetical protein
MRFMPVSRMGRVAYPHGHGKAQTRTSLVAFRSKSDPLIQWFAVVPQAETIADFVGKRTVYNVEEIKRCALIRPFSR